MPTIYALKPRFQALLRPLTARLAAAGVTANQITLAALGLSVAEGLAMALQPGARWPWLLLPLVLLIRMALNAIDGLLAREHGMQSALGAMLNELGDVASDLALYAPLAVLPAVSGTWVAVFVVMTVVAEMAGVVAVQIGASRRYDGPLGKSDRAFAFGLAGLLLGLGLPAGGWLNGALALLSLLGLLTIANRMRAALREATA